MESNSPVILISCESNLDNSIDSSNFFVRNYILLIQKQSYSYAWPTTLRKECYSYARPANLWTGESSFCTWPFFSQLWWFLFPFEISFSLSQCLISFTSINFHSLPCAKFLILLPTVKPSVDVLIFGDCNVPHMDCLTYSDGIDTPDELFNFPRLYSSYLRSNSDHEQAFSFWFI